MTDLLFAAYTMPGIEDIAWLEIREHLPQAQFVDKLFVKEQNGVVLFQYGGPMEALSQLRTVENILLVALTIDKVTRGWKDLYRLTDQIAKRVSFGNAVDELMAFQRSQNVGGAPTFRVVSRLHGRYEYKRKDLEKSVFKGMKARYPHWQPVSGHARVELWSHLLGARLICGFRLTDGAKRLKKSEEMKGTLRPSIAAAMIHLTEPEASDRFLDPMSGSGTLLMARRVAGPYHQLLGGDIDAGATGNTRLNVQQMRKERPSSFTACQLDAAHLPFATGTIDKVATNLPFGKQIGSQRRTK
ncbi:MAG: hypothetical protein KC421_05605, partial [Anaerolineales bacterium]|nr:hypothetical protein [Anaerolineales bacterium]